MNNAMATKNHLIEKLNEASGDQNTLCVFCVDVLCPVLENTMGLWLELSYGYKAAEIAERAMRSVDSFIVDGLHHKTEKRLTTLRHRLLLLTEQYYTAHHQQKSDELAALGLEYMTNVELSA